MRNYAQISLSIWNDDDFRQLTPQAQHLYFILISHPSLSYCGVGDWRPARLAALAGGWTRLEVEAAGAELADQIFIVIDEDTEEYLVRTFVRNDPLMRQRNLGVSMARAYSMVASEGIRGVVVHELRRLKREQPELKGWESEEVVSVLSKSPIDPKVYPCGNPSVDPSGKGSVDPSVDPKGDPSIDPSVKGSVDPSVDPSVKGSVDPSVDPSPTPSPSPTPLLSRGLRFASVVQSAGANDEQTTPSDDSMDSALGADAPGRPDWARGTIDDPRCPDHEHLARENVPACRACARARQWWQQHEATTKAEGKAARRAAIDACDLCDTNGITLAVPAARCTHQKTGLEDPQADEHAENGQPPTGQPQTRHKATPGPF